MGNRTAKFVSALIGGIIAGAPLAAVSQNAPAPSSAASTASDCLAAPKGAAPQGQHWYYRLERTTKRQCWYLRAAGDKDSAKAAQTAQAPSDTPTADAPAPQQHAVQDARAEYLTPRSSAAAKTPNAPAQAAATPVQQVAEQTADGNAQQPAGAPPWPDVSTASAPPAPPAPTVVAAPAQPGAKPSKSPSPVTLAAADSTTDKPTGSLQTLLLVIGGALALAGILGSVVYRLAGVRARRQSADRHGHWGDREIQNEDGSRAPWLASTPADARPPHPIDFDAVRPQPKKQGTKLAAIGREIELIDARRQRAAAPAAEPVEVRRDKVEMKAVGKTIATVAAAPQLAANEIGENRDSAPQGHDTDAVDIDVITTMLEQLAKEGPRLSRPNLEADLANFARSLRGQSAARA
ncbi:hypothetical protein [Bradyrhizobium sp. CCBAU 25338]|uniref:hypothetical protein n=1 Tax=Bradyrhizobium sp. CCBAU 25338 TaxID=1641877 RepID=UPI00230311D5|nr:hypothetical protein [Bradyrhizobium sp. CCBAU 25338]MDA9531545.1 hypothetical protein [Bradyrhizobium sp. CCBAU 25338]